MLQVSEINAVVQGRLDLSPVQARGMLFVISGTGSLDYSREKMEVCRGRVFFLDEGSGMHLEPGSTLRGFLVCFEKLFLADFLLHYPRFRYGGVFGSSSFLDVSSCDVLAVVEELRWLKAEIESGSALVRLKVRFNLVMLLVCGGLELPGELEDSLKLTFVSLLDSSFRSHRTSGFYADKLGVTMRRLNLLCRSWFDGKGFVVVHRERLLCEAEYLLLETEKPVKEIAFELEFCSQQHFRGYFFRAKGMSPSSFRRGLRMNFTV